MKTILLTNHLLPLNFDLQIPEADSPNSLLFGLLGFLIIGVFQAVYVLIQVQKDAHPKPTFTISDAQLN